MKPLAERLKEIDEKLYPKDIRTLNTWYRNHISQEEALFLRRAYEAMLTVLHNTKLMYEGEEISVEEFMVSVEAIMAKMEAGDGR